MRRQRRVEPHVPCVRVYVLCVAQVQVCTDIVYFAEQTLTYYRGSYDTFEAVRDEKIKNQVRGRGSGCGVQLQAQWTCQQTRD
jgi:hypothetical protein